VSIPQTAIDRLNNYFGLPGASYMDFRDGGWIDIGCLVWSLRSGPDQEPSALEQYQALLAKAFALHQDDPNHPDLGRLFAEAKEVIKPFKPHYRYGIPYLTPSDFLRRDPLKGIHRDWWKARELLQDMPVQVFLGYAESGEMPRHTGDKLILAPVNNAFDYLRLRRTAGMNWGYDTERIVLKLGELEQQFGIVVVGAGSDWVELILERQLKRKEASRLRKWLLEFCPSIEDAWSSALSGRIALWWD
jgi:hypothetical protein